MHRFFAAVALCLLAGGAQAATVLDEHSIRDYLAAQDRAWNMRDFDGFYASFRANAEIVTVRKNKNGNVTRQVNTVGEARRDTVRFFATHRQAISETDTIERITIAPDRRHARARVREDVRMTKDGHTKRLLAVTEQELGLQSGRIVSFKLTEYDER
jgi:hypothetical protein